MGKHDAYQPLGAGAVRRQRATYTVRRWSVRHAALLERFYDLFSEILLGLNPLWRLIGYRRVEWPMVRFERLTKGFFFDCRMCGQCILGSTGMACPMNCPKSMRNGPCGGVRADGTCEVEPDMPCVWVEAWKGSGNMARGDRILDVQKPIDHSLRETSSWLRLASRAAEEKESKESKES